MDDNLPLCRGELELDHTLLGHLVELRKVAESVESGAQIDGTAKDWLKRVPTCRHSSNHPAELDVLSFAADFKQLRQELAVVETTPELYDLASQ